AVGPHQAARPEGPGIEGAVGQGGGGVDVADEVFGEQVGRALHPHEPFGPRQLHLAGGAEPGPALGAGVLPREAVEVAAGQPDRRQGGGDRLAEQRLARPDRPFQQQVPAGGQHGQDLPLRLRRPQPGVEQRQPPVGHQPGQLAAQVAHGCRSGQGTPHDPAWYIPSTPGFGAPPAAGASPSGTGHPRARIPAGQTTTPSGSPNAAASSAGRQAVTVAPSPASRAASIAAATPIIASPTSSVASGISSPGPASIMASRRWWRAGSMRPRSTSSATLAR